MSQRVQRLAAEALARAGVPGRVLHVRRRGGGLFLVTLAPGDASADEPVLVLEWRPVRPGEEVRAFRVGARYAASYRRAPGAWDVDDAATPAPIRELAYDACRALADVAESWSEAGAADEAALLPEPPWPADPIDRLVAALAHATSHAGGLWRFPLAAGWRLVEVVACTHWRRVAELRLAGAGRTLGFIVHPLGGDMGASPPYATSARLAIVYYTDDLPEDRHGGSELYERDTPLIEAVSDWLVRWDDAVGAQLSEG